jgi:hypothetical protein
MKTKSVKNTEVVEFSSMNEFYKYLCDTPFNDVFRWKKHSSVDGDEYFTGTKSFEEAVDLMKNGWKDMSQKLEKELKASSVTMEKVYKARNYKDVCGYQAIVPLYLQGIPNNMVNKKMVAVKQKVVTIDKSVDYSGSVNTQKIIDESVKALQIVKKIESQGVRCNLNIVIGSKEPDKNIFVKIRVKNASEKLNASKLAFPLVHPSMLRRLFFRFIEVHPTVTKSFVGGYGMPSVTNDLKEIFNDEYIIPAVFRKDISEVHSLDDLI